MELYLSRCIKVSFFQATVESVLLYGCESWTLKETLRKSLDGCYTRMLRAVLNINWSEHVTTEQLYGVLPRLSQGCFQEDAICGSYSQTPGASSWQTCTMGAVMCTWAPIKGSPHKNICRGFSAGCWGGELCGAGQVYGGRTT